MNSHIAPKNRFLWLLPVTLLGLIIASRVNLFWNSYSDLSRLRLEGSIFNYFNRHYILPLLIWPGILLSEVLVYFIGRKKLNKRVWVVLHVTSLFLAFIALPRLNFYFVRIHNIGENNFFSFWELSFWFLIIVG